MCSEPSPDKYFLIAIYKETFGFKIAEGFLCLIKFSVQRYMS